jgi:hypothetical protein
MKGISVLILMLLASCNPATSLKGTSTNPTSPAPLNSTIPTTPVPPVVHLENSNNHDLVIEIDQVNNIFTVTGNAGKVCGIEFNVIDRLNYEVLSADQAKITHNGRVYDLTRVDHTNQEKIWGDWETEITEGDYQGHMIFHIKLDPVMNVESDCEAIP